MHALALLAPASACAKERCACIAGRAEHALVKTSTSALKLGANAESGLVDRAELERRFHGDSIRIVVRRSVRR